MFLEGKESGIRLVSNNFRVSDRKGDPLVPRNNGIWVWISTVLRKSCFGRKGGGEPGDRILGHIPYTQTAIFLQGSSSLPGEGKRLSQS